MAVVQKINRRSCEDHPNVEGVIVGFWVGHLSYFWTLQYLLF